MGELTNGTFSASYVALFSDQDHEAALASLSAEREGERHDDQYALDRWWAL